MRFKVSVSYDGSSFHGWQVQPRVRTVQGEIEKVLSGFVGGFVRIVGAGRTDAGVHALGQVFHFDSPRLVSSSELFSFLASKLPEDIAVRHVEKVDKSFHARFSAKSKTYAYMVWRGNKSPFLSRYSWQLSVPLDIETMRWGASFIRGDFNFSPFVTSKALLEEKNPVRKVFLSEIFERKGFLVYVIKGASFLRYSVRSIVGTLVDLGRGVLGKKDFLNMIESGERNFPFHLAPPSGLFLISVEY